MQTFRKTNINNIKKTFQKRYEHDVYNVIRTFQTFYKEHFVPTFT